MTLLTQFNSSIQKAIDSHLTTLATRFNVPVDQALLLWNAPLETPPLQAITYSKLSKAQLVDICKSKGLFSVGTKAQLISILEGGPAPLPKVKAKTAKEIKTQKQVEKFGNVSTIVVRRNAFNNFESPQTGFIFNPSTKKVFGIQHESGSITPLTKADIEKCKMLKLKYDPPANLEAEVGLDSVQVDELQENDFEEEEFSDEDEDDDVDDENEI
jgi:hypothetical protein